MLGERSLDWPDPVEEKIKRILSDALGLGERANALSKETRLLGGIPEFDSVAVVTVITALEERFGIVIDDDELKAELFETLGNLSAFVTQKLHP